MKQWDIKRLLEWITEYLTSKSIDSTRLSAEMLLSHTLDLKRIDLYTNYDRVIADPQLNKLRELVKRAAENEPIAYLVGKKEFYSIELDINSSCLIPRPETEMLVVRAIEFLRDRGGTQLVCDLCTGSGCIAVAIAKNFDDSKVIATDISDLALEVAERNIEKYNLTDRVNLLCGDLFDPIISQLDKAKFDLIVCNPPYVTTDEYETLAANVKDFEPKYALIAGHDGLNIYRRICEKVADYLKEDAALIFEIGYAQGQTIKNLLQGMNLFNEITLEKDFLDNDRIIIAQK